MRRTTSLPIIGGSDHIAWRQMPREEPVAADYLSLDADRRLGDEVRDDADIFFRPRLPAGVASA